jgi:hypothetical protein
MDSSGTPEQLKVRGRSQHLNKSFEQIITDELKELKDNGVDENSTVEEFYGKIMSNKPMDHGGHSVIFRGLYCFQVEAYLREFPSDQLLILSINSIKGDITNLHQTMEKVFRFINLPMHEITDNEVKNKRSYDKVSEETKCRLEEFYRPYNQRLFKLLGYELDW